MTHTGLPDDALDALLDGSGRVSVPPELSQVVERLRHEVARTPPVATRAVLYEFSQSPMSAQPGGPESR